MQFQEIMFERNIFQTKILAVLFYITSRNSVLKKKHISRQNACYECLFLSSLKNGMVCNILLIELVVHGLKRVENHWYKGKIRFC